MSTITHRVIDLAVTEYDSYFGGLDNVIMNGSWQECEDFVANQTDFFTYKVEPLLPYEKEFLNSYDTALKTGNTYIKTGRNIFTVLLILCSFFVNAQINEDKNTFVLIGFMAGYNAKINVPVSGLSFGVRTGNVYLGVNSIIPVTSNAEAPIICTGNVGYNIGALQPFLGITYQSVGKVMNQYLKVNEGRAVNGWKPVYGLSYFFRSFPLQLTAQRTGNSVIISVSLYKSL